MLYKIIYYIKNPTPPIQIANIKPRPKSARPKLFQIQVEDIKPGLPIYKSIARPASAAVRPASAARPAIRPASAAIRPASAVVKRASAAIRPATVVKPQPPKLTVFRARPASANVMKRTAAAKPAALASRPASARALKQLAKLSGISSPPPVIIGGSKEKNN